MKNIKPIKKETLDEVINGFINSIQLDNKTYQQYLKSIAAKKNKLNNFISPGRSSNKNNELVVLRRWNSNTPLLAEHQSASNKGGGYFISYNDFGIVIDPGYNFIENFASAGYKLDDIDAIFITHAHDDHTMHLEGLFSMLNKRRKYQGDPKKIDLYLNLGSFKKFSAIINLSKGSTTPFINKIVLLNAHQNISINDDIGLFTTHAKHDENITLDYSLGFTFVFNKRLTTGKRILKFTSDTAWNTDNEKINYEQFSEYYIEKPNILICHLGSITENEINDYDIKKSLVENEIHLYDNHLGLIGTLAEIEKWDPEITLVSEFGLELEHIRIDLVKLLSNHLKKFVFPVDLNFRINIDSLEILSHKSRRYFSCDQLSYSENKDNSIVYYNSLTDFDAADIGNIGAAALEVKPFI